MRICRPAHPTSPQLRNTQAIIRNSITSSAHWIDTAKK